MKKLIFTVLSLIFLQTQLFSQTFIDDFEFYTPGSFLASSSTSWGTWNNLPGGTEDVTITNANASSGSNSIYFSSNVPGGGPDDVILPFPVNYTTGTVTFDANFFIENGKGAYFNIQETTIPGQGWALEVHMNQNGGVTLRSGLTTIASYNSIIPAGQWFNLKVLMDLDTDNWDLIVNNISHGPFTNNVGSVGMLDLYASNETLFGGNNLAGFYVDDVSFDHTITNTIDHNGELRRFNIFPNPSRGVFFIEINEHDLNPFSLIITDMSGKVIWQENYTSISNKKISFPSGLLSTGVYLVSLESNGNINHKKLVIQ